MKNLITLVTCLIFGTVALAQTEKRVEKNYNNSDFTAVKITNSFGDIEVIPHQSSNIDVLIVLTVESSKDKDATEFLNNIDFVFVGNGKTLEITTQNKTRETNFNWKGKMTMNLKFMLKVPENLNIDIKNSFGDVKINGTTGALKLDVQHGDCFIAYANGSNNNLKVMFGDVRIESFSKGEIEMQHGDLNINKAHDLTLDIQFGDIDIDMLGGYSELDIAHGDLEIDAISNKFSGLKIDTQFGDVDIVGLSTQNIDMDLSGTFTDFSFDKSWKRGNSSNGINNVQYRMKSGAGPDYNKLLKITASHSDVDLK